MRSLVVLSIAQRLPAVVATLSAALLLVPMASQGFSDGANIDGFSSSGCGGCHGSQPTGSVGVSLTGSPTISPNDSEIYTLVIATGGVGGSFDVTLVGDATLSTSEPNAQVVNGGKDFVNSSSARPNNVGDWSYSFVLTVGDLAPGTELTLRAVGMQFDDPSNADSGDLWNFADTTTLTVTAGQPVPTAPAWLLVAAILGASVLYFRRMSGRTVAR
jgi:hypothetical protein